MAPRGGGGGGHGGGGGGGERPSSGGLFACCRAETVVSGDVVASPVKADIGVDIAALANGGAGITSVQGGGNASWIVGLVYVFDQLSASARAEDTIVCEPATISVSDLANLTATLIAISFESGDVEAVFQATVASSSVKTWRPTSHSSISARLTTSTASLCTCAALTLSSVYGSVQSGQQRVPRR